MKELSLFAGIGGGMLGTQSIGINTICAVEIDKHCQLVLNKRMLEGHFSCYFDLWSDIKTFNGDHWRNKVDIVSGGFPCQAFSSAARGRNNAENLWPQMCRVIDEVKPEYVFAENVSRKSIETAANDCASMGYKTEMLSLSASDLGADHERERFWLLAYADNKSKLRSTINAKVASMQEFRGSIWQTNPGHSGVANGTAGRVERYRATGNGQIPIVAAAALWTLANA